MAAVEVTISGVLYDKLNRTQQSVVLIGDASLTGLGIGGGPIIPPPGAPPGTHPMPPIYYPPVISGGPGWLPPVVMPPIYYPPDVPPGLQPPTPPNPGDPTSPVPPPAGSTGWPVQSVVPPPYMIVNYPGIGPVVVAPPAPSPP